MTTETTIVEAPLSIEERGDLARHQATITRGQQTFIEVGLALADISRRRLYRETHQSLEAWLADEYPDISRRRAYQLMDGAEIAQQLAAPPADVNHGTQPPPPPTSERQVRPLAGLEPAQQREAYQRAAEAAGGRPPTSAQVEQAARAVRPPPPATPPPAGVVIAEAPATTPAAPPPLPALTPLTPLSPLDTGALRVAEATVALLEQALTVAQVERDRLQRELPDAHYAFPDEPVEVAAREFLASPAVRAAASFLALAAREAVL